MFSKEVALIAGVPRSGTSWLGELINSSPEVCYRWEPYISYEFGNFINHSSGKKEYEAFFDALAKSDDSFLLRKDKREKGLYPQFEKNDGFSMLLLKEASALYLFSKIFPLFPNFKMICLIRNPCAVINSWVKSPSEFPPNASVEDEWRFGACKNEGKEKNFYGFYKWREAANLFRDLKNKFPDKVRIVKYEELVIDTYTQTEKIFNFLNIPVTRQTENFVNASHLMHIEGSYPVFKDKSVKDNWKHELSQSIIDEIYYELSDTLLAQFLL